MSLILISIFGWVCGYDLGFSYNYFFLSNEVVVIESIVGRRMELVTSFSCVCSLVCYSSSSYGHKFELKLSEINQKTQGKRKSAVDLNHKYSNSFFFTLFSSGSIGDIKSEKNESEDVLKIKSDIAGVFVTVPSAEFNEVVETIDNLGCYKSHWEKETSDEAIMLSRHFSNKDFLYFHDRRLNVDSFDLKVVEKKKVVDGVVVEISGRRDVGLFGNEDVMNAINIALNHNVNSVITSQKLVNVSFINSTFGSKQQSLKMHSASNSDEIEECNFNYAIQPVLANTTINSWPKYVSEQTSNSPNITIIVLSSSYGKDNEDLFVNITVKDAWKTTCYCHSQPTCTYNKTLDWVNVTQNEANNVTVQLVDQSIFNAHQLLGTGNISLLSCISTNKSMCEMNVSMVCKDDENGSVRLLVNVQVMLQPCTSRDSAEGNCTSRLDTRKCLQLQSNNSCIEDHCPVFYEEDSASNTCLLLDCRQRDPVDDSCHSPDDSSHLPGCIILGGKCVDCFSEHYYSANASEANGVCTLKNCSDRTAVAITGTADIPYPCGGNDCFLQPDGTSCGLECTEEGYVSANGVCSRNDSCYSHPDFVDCVTDCGEHYMVDSTHERCVRVPCEQRRNSGAATHPCGVAENDTCSLQINGSCGLGCADFTEDSEGEGICSVLDCTLRKPVNGKCSLPSYDDSIDRCSFLPENENCSLCPDGHTFFEGMCCNIQPDGSCKLNCPTFYVPNHTGVCLIQSCTERIPQSSRVCRIDATDMCGFLDEKDRPPGCTFCPDNYYLDSDGECKLNSISCTELVLFDGTTSCVDSTTGLENEMCGSLPDSNSSCDLCLRAHYSSDRGVCTLRKCSLRTRNDSATPHVCGSSNCKPVTDNSSNACYENEEEEKEGEVSDEEEEEVEVSNEEEEDENVKVIKEGEEDVRVSSPFSSTILVVVIVCAVAFIALIIGSIVTAVYLLKKRKGKGKTKVGTMEEEEARKYGHGGDDEEMGIASEDLPNKDQEKLSINSSLSSSISDSSSHTASIFPSSSSLSVKNSKHSTHSNKITKDARSGTDTGIGTGHTKVRSGRSKRTKHHSTQKSKSTTQKKRTQHVVANVHAFPVMEQPSEDADSIANNAKHKKSCSSSDINSK